MRFWSHDEWWGRLFTCFPYTYILVNLLLYLSRYTCLASLFGLNKKARLPAYTEERFLTSFRKIKQHRGRYKVVFFAGCNVNYHQPQLGIDLVKVYQHNDIEVATDRNFCCCGAKLLTAGDWDKAKKNAAHNIELLNAWVKAGYDIVSLCPQCTLTLKQEYRKLVPEAQDDIYLAHLYDAMEYLWQLVLNGQLRHDFRKIGTPYVYYAPCKEKMLGNGMTSVNLLSEIPGFKAKIVADGCCGSACGYNLEKNRYHLAEAIGKNVFQAVKNSGREKGLTECQMCRFHLQQHTKVKFIHPLTLLRHAYKL